MLRCFLLVAVSLSCAAASAEVKGPIFYQDFDHGPTTLCGSGWAVDLPTQADCFVPGRFGRGYRVERGRTNHLSPNQASAEGGTEGFTAGAGVQLTSAAMQTRFGELETRLEQGRQTLPLTLGPGAAAVVAALPTAIARLEFPVPTTIKPGSETNLPLTLMDEAQNPPAGRQLAEVTITSPDGPWPATQRYQRIQDGRRTIPLRLPLTAARGKWQIRVKEWLSGLEVVKEFEVR